MKLINNKTPLKPSSRDVTNSSHRPISKGMSSNSVMTGSNTVGKRLWRKLSKKSTRGFDFSSRLGVDSYKNSKNVR